MPCRTSRRFRWVIATTITCAFVSPSMAQDALPKKQVVDLPVSVSSFGAVACDGWLYTYGGHVARVHTYSTEAVSGRFYRLNLSECKEWEELPSGPGLQGMNLAAYGGRIYRVGGMEPRNRPGEPTDNHSVADCACFDPALRRWQSLPPLPQARSSHDVAVVGDKLYVLGGWSMHGSEGEDWLDSAFVLDLQSPGSTWKAIPQPFKRRALIVAVHRNQIFAIGGFNEDNRPERRVDIYDPGTNDWSTGPELPGPDQNGFAPAACTLGDNLYVSVSDGSLYRLDESGRAWTAIAKLQPRIVHRLAPHESHILVIGGARAGENLRSIETVAINTGRAEKCW